MFELLVSLTEMSTFPSSLRGVAQDSLWHLHAHCAATQRKLSKYRTKLWGTYVVGWHVISSMISTYRPLVSESHTRGQTMTHVISAT